MRNHGLHDLNLAGTLSPTNNVAVDDALGPSGTFKLRLGAVSGNICREGFGTDRSMTCWIDGKLQPPDRFVDPKILICSIGFRFLAADRSLGETSLPAAQVSHLGERRFEARRLDDLTHSLMCVAVSA
jgi:hypothetical protein